MESTIVFIDAGFLSKLSKHFGNGIYLIYDLLEFLEYLSKKQNLFCKKTFYYTASPFISNNPNQMEIKRKKDYDNFIAKLSRNKNFIIREGRCQRLKIDGEFVYKQKGVDSLAVIDLVNVLIDYPDIKRVIIIASDSDFVPVINNLEKRGIKTILYTYYERGRKATFSTSNELIKSVHKYILLTKEDFTSCPIKKIKEIENELWSEGSYIKSINPKDFNFEEKIRYFEEKSDDKKENNCKKCNKRIGKHNLYWHEEMCNECFFDEYNM